MSDLSSRNSRSKLRIRRYHFSSVLTLFFAFVQVIFTQKRDLKFSRLETRKCVQYNSIHKIFFENKFCLDAFNKLLEHRCGICNRDDTVFDVLEELEVHLKREHDMFLCELCVAHLKIFSSERRYYSRKELRRHKNSGDPENRSHRGHPLCDLCNQRYMDEDDLLRHLRRDHFFCHICVEDGPNEFYDTYDRLREHFRDKHFLCEEGACRDEKFTSVFRTEIDWQAHFTRNHCTSKHDLKNARTIRLDLNIQRNSLNSASTTIGLQSTNRGDYRRPRNNQASSTDDAPPIAAPPVSASQSLPRIEDFPELPLNARPQTAENENATNGGNSASSIPIKKMKSKTAKTFSSRFSASARANDDFPELEPSLPTKAPSFLTGPVSLNRNKSTFKYQNYRNDIRPEANPTGSGVGTVNRYADISSNGLSGKASIREDEFPGLPSLVIKKSKKTKKQSKQEAKQAIEQESENLAAAIKASLSTNSTDAPKSQSKVNPINSNQTGNTKKEEISSTLNDFPSIGETANKKMLSLKVPPGLTKINANGKGNPPPGYKNNQEDKLQETLGSLAQQLVAGSLPTVPKEDNNDSATKKGGSASPKPTFKSKEPKTSKSRNGNRQNQSDSDLTNTYMFPSDFDLRNVELFRLIRQSLKEESYLDTFRSCTENFRRSVIDGQTYYKRCIELFGRNEFNAVFAELLALMPHIGKQNELLSAYEKHFSLNKSTTTKKFTSGSSKGVLTFRNDQRVDFLVCPKCRQVLAKKDGPEHIANH